MKPLCQSKYPKSAPLRELNDHTSIIGKFTETSFRAVQIIPGSCGHLREPQYEHFVVLLGHLRLRPRRFGNWFFSIIRKWRNIYSMIEFRCFWGTQQITSLLSPQGRSRSFCEALCPLDYRISGEESQKSQCCTHSSEPFRIYFSSYASLNLYALFPCSEWMIFSSISSPITRRSCGRVRRYFQSSYMQGVTFLWNMKIQ